MGNGLLVFIDEKVKMKDFFKKNEIVYYKSIDDLANKIKYFKKNDLLKKKIEKIGKKKYF